MRTPSVTVVVAAFLSLAACGGESSAPGSTSPGQEGNGGEPPAVAGPTTPPSTPTPTPPAPPKPGPTAPTTLAVDCAKFVVTGDPTSAKGATWTYAATHDNVAYSLNGILLAPAGTGKHPAVVVSHGYGGSPAGFSAKIAKEMVGWGLVAIGTQYSHSGTPDTSLPKGDFGTSKENIQRAHATRALLGCLDNVDTARVAAHGHSMGGFVTAELVGTYPQEFVVASHTAGGTNEGGMATKPVTAELIVTPYQMHHGDADTVVAIEDDRRLHDILVGNTCDTDFREYPGFGHTEIPFDATMFTRVHEWYATHGLF